MMARVPDWILIAFLAVTSTLVPALEARCSGEILDWEPVPEDQYDRTYSEINMADARPLGYKVASYSYNRGESICVKVFGTQDRHLEVKIETQPAAKLCVRSTADGAVENCVDSKTLGLCERFVAEAGNFTIFEFYCTGECSESDVNFWYRFKVCPEVSYDDNEYWCQNVEDDYPSTLLVFSPRFLTTTTIPPVAGATTASVSIALFITGWGASLYG